MQKPTTLIKSSIRSRFVSEDLRIGVLHAGGPAPGGNQVLYAAALRSKDHDLKMAAFPHGYDHLMTDRPEDVPIVQIGQEHIRYLRDQQALVIGTSRANPGREIKTTEDLNDPAKTRPLTQVLEVFEAHRIGALISIGGDDTMRSANLLQTHFENLRNAGRKFRHFMGVVHVPKTVDKDYVGIDFTFGFMSTAEYIGASVKAFHDDAKASATESRPVYHVVEVMGRKAGWLTAAASIYGQATFALCPEDFADRTEITPEEVGEICMDLVLKRRQQGKHYGAITIAEAIGDLFPRSAVETDEHGHIRLDQLEPAQQLTRVLINRMKAEHGVEIRVHAHKAGYGGRQIHPGIFDVLLCQRLGVSAVDAVLHGHFAHMVSVEGVFNPKFVPFRELIDPTTLRAHSWIMGENEGLWDLMVAMQQPF